MFVPPRGAMIVMGLSKPYRTLNRALEEMQGRSGSIVLRQGVYRESISITSLHSGITITSMENETAALSGAVPISPRWTRWVPPNASTPSNIWRTKIDDNELSFAGLRVNGQPAIRARYPNANPATTLNPEGWVSTPSSGLRLE